MTLKQLLNETYALGFEEPSEISDGFVFAANRALIRIVSELGADSISNISIPSDGSVLIKERLDLARGESASFSLSGCAYSLTVSGRGSLLVEADGKSTVIPFSGSLSAVRGFISGDATITFRADSGVTVTDLCSFEFTDALSEGKIPLYSEARRIPLSALIPDFFRASAPPQDSRGQIPASVTLTGDSIYPERGFSGKLTVRYKRYPQKISRDDPEGAVDIPRELEALLPLLTASYIWLDDDPERSQYYLELYLAEASRIKKTFPTGFDTYKNVTGWA